MPCRADGKGTGLGPMTEEDYRMMESQSSITLKSKLEEEVQSMEEDLCIVRDLLFKMIDNRDLPENAEVIINEQLMKHREHRMEDYESINTNINNELSTVNKAINFRENYIKWRYEESNTLDEYEEGMKPKRKRVKELEEIKKVFDNTNVE
ncbi:MAG: hypothetical protein GTO02_15485, partial [Candidatus Dadabacteria bacterium]|nr:hypothetical protein [Candidatus Dadabacteria bacterium]NIQ15739.1 hypothetical protein [Candidatus Dadabacteria bacterium]